MGSKVYLVYIGPPDDRVVRGVYSTRERAEAAVRLGGEETMLEEHQLDAPLPEAPPGHTYWAVSVYQGSAQVLPANGLLADDVDEVDDYGGEQVVHLWAPDEAHALKEGLEKIRKVRG